MNDIDTIKMNATERCQHYGRFMSTLNRPQAEGLYWTFFSMVVLLLFGCSWNYGRMMEKIEHMSTANPQRQRLLRRGFWLAIVGGLIACTVGIMAAFTLLTLQFCDGEPLSSLYWSTWTVLVVGGIVAIFGISLHIRHLIKSRRPPPWALALGTPVLVVAGLGHYFQGKLSRKARRIVERGREVRRKLSNGDIDLNETRLERSDSVTSTSSAPSSPSPTSGDNPYENGPNEWNAKIIRITETGDVVIRIAPQLEQELNANLDHMSSLTLSGPQELSTPKFYGKSGDVMWSPHRASSAMSTKGKEKEASATQTDDSEGDRETIVNDGDVDVKRPTYQ